MPELLIALVLLIAFVSGTSKPLLLLALVLIVSVSTGRLILDGFRFRINHINLGKFALFFLILVLVIASMPLENSLKFVQTIASAIMAVMLFRHFKYRSVPSQIRILYLVLAIILIGDLIHLAGVLGDDMNSYKAIVQFDELSNLEREGNFGLLGLRYYGWFAEPSYHGVFTGLACAAIYARGRKATVLLVAILFFLLCPTPMMLLAFAAGVVMGRRKTWLVFFRRPYTTVAIIFAMYFLLDFLFASRFATLLSGIAEVYGGEAVNTSEAVRLINPVIALLSHLSTHGLLPEPSSCIENGTCLPASLKFPLISYLIFFGIGGLFALWLLGKWLYRSSGYRVLLALIIGSVLSGGAGYVLQFGLIVALLLQMQNHRPQDGFAPKIAVVVA